MHRLTKEDERRGAIALNKILARNKEMNARRISLMRKAVSSPQIREKMSLAKKKYYRSMRNRMKTSRAVLKIWTKERRKQESKRLKNYYQHHPEIARKIDKSVTAWWTDHSNIKKEMSKRVREFFMKNPEEFKRKFMNGKNNPNKPHIPTKLGLVRSLGEKKIADFLFFNHIKAEYEAKPLMLDGWICVPDFYLPKQKVYIEFYGGYPGSWKKKVMKNKLYKKHRIKVISITPSELNELDGLFNASYL